MHKRNEITEFIKKNRSKNRQIRIFEQYTLCEDIKRNETIADTRSKKYKNEKKNNKKA